MDAVSEAWEYLKKKYYFSLIKDVKIEVSDADRVEIDYMEGLAKIFLKEDDCDVMRCVFVHEYMHIYLFEATKITFFARAMIYERAYEFIDVLYDGTVEADHIFTVIQDLVLMAFMRDLGDDYIIESQKFLFRRSFELYRTSIVKMSDRELLKDLGYHLWSLIFFVITSHIFPDWLRSEERTELLNLWRRFSRREGLNMKQKTLISATLASIRELLNSLHEYLELETEEKWFNVLDVLVDTLINFVAKQLRIEGEIAFYVEETKIDNTNITKVSITAV